MKRDYLLYEILQLEAQGLLVEGTKFSGINGGKTIDIEYINKSLVYFDTKEPIKMDSATLSLFFIKKKTIQCFLPYLQ